MSPRASDGVQYFPAKSLVLKEDVTGAKMWAVALANTMLTYFDVQPECRFESHRHESEQITLVLEGELFSEILGQIVRVGTGEVIAIPSNVQHAVFTKETAVKAVDAWSPIMKSYSE